MKLFSAYKDIIAEIKPTLVWFTTFNLNIELVEKFLLPVLVGKEPYDLRTAEDYEALNTELISYNIKVWYDFNAISFQNDKRTTIDLEAIDANKLLKSRGNDLIFHPKVIFLKGESSSYIIVSSANLSVAAWHSNRECFLIREVSSKKNALEIIHFFESINSNSRETKELKKWSESLPDIKTAWNFRHNFNIKANLLHELSGDKLYVWSPYFSKEISDLINEFRKIGIKHITLIPDIDQIGRVRIISEELEHIKKDPDIEIYKDGSIQEGQNLMHAKVWLSEKKIGIGSWNCSFRATGIKVPFNQRNVEAGIILDILPKECKRLIDNLELVTEQEVLGVSEEELDADWSNGLQGYSMCVQISADWNTFTYDIVQIDFSEEYRVCLPDLPGERIPLSSVKGKSFFKNSLHLLKNKAFTVYNVQGEIVYAGYIMEYGKSKRPTASYVSLLDLFESLIADPLGETTQKRVRYTLDDEDADISDGKIPLFNYSGHESNYLMFVSFQKLRDSIYAVKDNPIKMDDLGFRLPGSIGNIVLLVTESVKRALEVGNEDDLLFHYFLCDETNKSIEVFNGFSERKFEQIPLNELDKQMNLGGKERRFLKKIK